MRSNGFTLAVFLYVGAFALAGSISNAQYSYYYYYPPQPVVPQPYYNGYVPQYEQPRSGYYTGYYTMQPQQPRPAQTPVPSRVSVDPSALRSQQQSRPVGSDLPEVRTSPSAAPKATSAAVMITPSASVGAAGVRSQKNGMDTIKKLLRYDQLSGQKSADAADVTKPIKSANPFYDKHPFSQIQVRISQPAVR